MPDTTALLIWQKIQTSPNSGDISETLRCAIHDPLWLLSRQWQMGEFQAEDAGMAAFAHMTSVSTPIQRILSFNSSTSSIYDPEEMPLNALIEEIPSSFNLTQRWEAGRMWQKMLVSAGKEVVWQQFQTNPLFQFKKPEFKYEPDNNVLNAFNDESHEHLIAALGRGRMVDGGILFVELNRRKASEFLAATDSLVDQTGETWLTWVKQQLGISITGSTGSWESPRLEYAAAVSAAMTGNTTIALNMPDYNGSLMESFSWERVSEKEALKTDINHGLITIHNNTFIPVPVSFPSMPGRRWWEFEDSTIDLGNLQAEKTDIGLLLLAEFGLMYSNDWLLTPLAIPVGHLAKVRSLRVTDVFGVQSYIKAIQQNNTWELFQLSSDAMPESKGWLYLPPVNNNYLQGDIIEDVHFVRDEMANLVWGVEMTAPDSTGQGVEALSAARRLEEWLKHLAGINESETAPVAEDIVADVKYSIGSTVQPNWIPFIPVRNVNSESQMVLRRAAMPRFNANHSPSRIRPQTDILRGNTGRYDIQEEEIASTGITVRQMWRRARWFDGRTITWLAREKSIGRHMDNSGLQFDILK